MPSLQKVMFTLHHKYNKTHVLSTARLSNILMNWVTAAQNKIHNHRIHKLITIPTPKKRMKKAGSEESTFSESKIQLFNSWSLEPANT